MSDGPVTRERFPLGDAPAILWSIVRLPFWATVACFRLTFRAMERVLFFSVGFWIGYAATRRLGRIL